MKAFFLFLLAIPFIAGAQTCTSKIVFTLNNIKGGVYTNQSVTLKSKNDGKEYTGKSDVKGEAAFTVPCEQTFDVRISNYTAKEKASSPPAGTAFIDLMYEPDMAKKDELFAMSAAEKAAVDRTAAALPDTTFLKGSIMSRPANVDQFCQYRITLKNLESGPLANEQIVLTGAKSKKSFKGVTDRTGTMSVFLPKGDEYSLHFIYSRDYYTENVTYTKGSSNAESELMYMGTVEFLRRKKAEEERIKAEEKRLAEEKAAFEKRCKEAKISELEGHKRELEKPRNSGNENQLISKVLGRNKWTEKLIVCDLTGSMDPYASQLSAWYQLNYKLEKNLQFVFFNDGDDKEDGDKVIGSTGGIYYQPAKGLDSLITLMATVRSNGSGGDCPENNMEALIKGVKIAKPYKELVMVVDNNAPVKDIELLKSFNKPVHIILCGASSGYVLEDYLLIAWKTKGSIHTIEEDITKIATMLEGESIMVGGVNYKIMGGAFVRIAKV